VAYGSLHGYATTLSEGAGYKQIVISTRFPDVDKLNQLQAAVNGRNIARELRVQNLSFAPNGVSIIFTDNPGTMKKIEEFIAWFYPLLDQAGATGAKVCAECGMEAVSGCWKLIDGVALYMHDACAQKVTRDIDAEYETQREESIGSYGTGLLGALLGAALGAVVWALILLSGFVASIVGLLIGWLADKGYDLLKGKQGKGKIAILIIAVIFGVVAGTFAADAISLTQMIDAGELLGWEMGDIPLIMLMMFEDTEYVTATLSNVGMGLLFAALGVFSLLRKTNKAVSKAKVIDLP
jgi:hypothetical protein